MDQPLPRKSAAGAGGGKGGGGGDGGDGEYEDDTEGRKINPAKAASKIWKQFKPYRGKIKTNGLSGKDRRYYEWDHLHNDIEVFDHKSQHLGSMDPVTGEMYKTSKGHTPSFKN